MSDFETTEDQRVIDALMELRSSQGRSFHKVGPMWDRIKSTRGEAFAHGIMTLISACSDSFDLRIELAVLFEKQPTLKTLHRKAIRFQIISFMTAFAFASLFFSSYSMQHWVVKIVEITGVPGLALLLIYFFWKPIGDKFGMSKLRVEASEKLILRFSLGLIVLAIIAICVYGAPNLIRAFREPATKST